LLTSTTPVPIMRVPTGGGVETHHDIVAGWSSLVVFLVGHKLLCQAVMEMVEKID
jgi:hypothetical protein